MKCCLKYFVGAAILLSPIAAHSADLTVKAPPAPVAAAVYNWTGLYIGVNGGWGWGRQDPVNLFDTRFDRASFDISGGMVGGTIGAQIQQGAVVLGVTPPQARLLSRRRPALPHSPECSAGRLEFCQAVADQSGGRALRSAA